MKILKAIVLFVSIIVLLLALPLLFLPDDAKLAPQPKEGMPWQIEKLPDGRTRVFGLVPGQSTLQNARERFGKDIKIALVVAPGESGSLEAYYESVTAGLITGKMVLTLDTTPEDREAMLGRAHRAEYMESATRRIDLAEGDLVAVEQLPIVAIVFIPSANLDEQIVLQRFGKPAERIRSDENREHFLYPDKGLDLQLDTQGKEVLQYVAPADFSRLRDPLTVGK